MADATFVISRRDLMPHPTQAERWIVRFPSGSLDTILSVQPDGSLQTRPMANVGAWETARDDGTRLTFPDTAGAVYALPLVD